MKTKKVLNQIKRDKFTFTGKEIEYHIDGLISDNPTFMTHDLELCSTSDGAVYKITIDLLNIDNSKEKLEKAADILDVNYATIIYELEEIREALKELQKQNTQVEKIKGFSTKVDAKAKKILGNKTMFKQIDKLIEQTGVVGENQSRLFLFLLAASYKTRYKFHSVIQSEDIELGSRYVENISRIVTEKQRKEIGIVSAKSIRYYVHGRIDGKLVVVKDYTNITQNRAIEDFIKAQATGRLMSSKPKKDEYGDLHTADIEVAFNSASIGASTDSKRYFSNQPKTVIVGMDNSEEQLEKLMDYECQLMCGELDEKKQEEFRDLLRHMVLNIEDREVVNPFARDLILPKNLPNARILTGQLLRFTALITLFKQHQRTIDDDGRVIAEKDDVKDAITMFMDSILISVDELDSPVRTFFEKIKILALNKKEKRNSRLTQPEIKQQLGISKSNINRCLEILSKNGYLTKEGAKNKGYSYQIKVWDETQKLKELILNKINHK